MSDGLVATLRGPIRGRADFGQILAGGWGALSAADFARRVVLLGGDAPVPLGDLFEVSGTPSGLPASRWITWAGYARSTRPG